MVDMTHSSDVDMGFRSFEFPASCTDGERTAAVGDGGGGGGGVGVAEGEIGGGF